MKIHWCFLDKECKDMDAPNRLHIGGLMIGAKSQWWDPWHGYTHFWSPISYRVRTNRLCEYQEEIGLNRFGKPAYRRCSRLKNHRGQHKILKW